MLTIIEREPRADGGHGVQSQSHRTECWLEGWVAVPEELCQAVWECGGYCGLELTGEGELVGLTPVERPPEPLPAPTEAERLRADVDFIAAMTGVELS